ncbi:MAG: NUDIX domain-containing protein [Chloroflexota bacterium]
MKEQRTRVAAYGLVTHDNKMLLCRLSKQLPNWAGHWTLPGGGLDFGEHPADAVVREIEEETGLTVGVGDVATIDSRYDDSGAHDHHGIRIIYHAIYMGGELRDEVSGTTDTCQWFSREEIQSITLVDLAALGVKLVFG